MVKIKSSTSGYVIHLDFLCMWNKFVFVGCNSLLKLKGENAGVLFSLPFFLIPMQTG